MSFDQIKQTALGLDLQARAALAQALLASLDDVSTAEHEQLWLEEAERRQEQVASGAVEMIPGPEVLRRLGAIG